MVLRLGDSLLENTFVIFPFTPAYIPWYMILRVLLFTHIPMISTLFMPKVLFGKFELLKGHLADDADDVDKTVSEKNGKSHNKKRALNDVMQY